jgi:hypothetical protein
METCRLGVHRLGDAVLGTPWIYEAARKLIEERLRPTDKQTEGATKMSEATNKQHGLPEIIGEKVALVFLVVFAAYMLLGVVKPLL